MKSNTDILFELIKFDMEQIRIYRQAILDISIACIAGSFGVIAYVFKKDSAIPNGRSLAVILMAQSGFALVLGVTAYAYFKGLDNSRSTLEMREDALRQCVKDPAAVVTPDDLYPDTNHSVPHDPKSPPYVMKSPPTLEELPIKIAMGLIGLETLGIVAVSCLKGPKEKVNRAIPDERGI